MGFSLALFSRFNASAAGLSNMLALDIDRPIGLIDLFYDISAFDEKYDRLNAYRDSRSFLLPSNFGGSAIRPAESFLVLYFHIV